MTYERRLRDVKYIGMKKLEITEVTIPMLLFITSLFVYLFGRLIKKNNKFFTFEILKLIILSCDTSALCYYCCKVQEINSKLQTNISTEI